MIFVKFEVDDGLYSYGCDLLCFAIFRSIVRWPKSDAVWDALKKCVCRKGRKPRPRYNHGLGVMKSAQGFDHPFDSGFQPFRIAEYAQPDKA